MGSGTGAGLGEEVVGGVPAWVCRGESKIETVDPAAGVPARTSRGSRGAVLKRCMSTSLTSCHPSSSVPFLEGLFVLAGGTAVEAPGAPPGGCGRVIVTKPGAPGACGAPEFRGDCPPIGVPAAEPVMLICGCKGCVAPTVTPDTPKVMVGLGGLVVFLENTGQAVLLPDKLFAAVVVFGITETGFLSAPTHVSYKGFAATLGSAATTPKPLSWKSMGEF
jgi:hypothetical protein